MSKESHELKQDALNALMQLSKANGGKITADEVVRVAADPDSPLHSYFEWDDNEAANKYRTMQARALIRTCTLKITTNKRTIKAPYYVRDPEADTMTQGYVETAKIRNDEDMKRDVLIAEFKRIGAALKRARDLGACFDMADEIDAMAEQVSGLASRVQHPEQRAD